MNLLKMMSEFLENETDRPYGIEVSGKGLCHLVKRRYSVKTTKAIKHFCRLYKCENGHILLIDIITDTVKGFEDMDYCVIWLENEYSITVRDNTNTYDTYEEMFSNIDMSIEDKYTIPTENITSL